MMNLKRSGAKSRDLGTAVPNTSHSATEAILGPKAAGETLDKIRPVPAKWARHYRRLLALRAGLEAERGDLASAVRQPLETSSLDIADVATDEFDHDLALCQLSHQQNALYEINQALRRMESGTYGICELSGKPIPEARLNAVPWTSFAVDVERKLERKRTVQRAHLGELRSVAGALPHRVDNIEVEEE